MQLKLIDILLNFICLNLYNDLGIRMNYSLVLLRYLNSHLLVLFIALQVNVL